MPRRTRTTGGIRAFALATVVLALLAGTVGYRTPQAAAEALAPGTDFTISTTITSSPTSADSPALLYPGVTRYLWYQVHNPLAQAITVTDLGIAGVQAPPGCPVTNLDLGQLGLTGAFIVPAGATATVLAPRPLSLRDLPVNQDACKDVTFTFTLSGNGWYSSATPQDPQDPPTPPDPGPAKVGTATQLIAGPNPAARGQVVTLDARVARTTGTVASGGAGAAAVPTGAVSFYLRSTTGPATLLGTIPLDAQGSAVLRLATLPPGPGELYAVYAGTPVFAGSTSALADQTIIAPPAACTGTYTTSILGTPSSPRITGTTGNDFIYAVGGNYRISAGRGNDCIVVGDGTNRIHDGSGADVVLAGHGRNTITLTGSRNTVILGDGSANRITVKGVKKGKKVYNASLNRISLGDGSANRVTIRKGNGNLVTIGNGSKNRVTIRRGSMNVVTVGAGSRNRVTVGKGSKNAITLGNGSKNRVRAKGTRTVVTLGSGTRNRVVMTRPKARSTCSLPAPPPTWRGKPARYYRDTFVG